MTTGDLPLIAVIRSGGQTGVDRGALDAARACEVSTEGWCPSGGWAEDFPESPGLLMHYPELLATPLRDPSQRTQWNVRDSHVTLILAVSDRSDRDLTEGDVTGCSLAASPGTEFTISCAQAYGRPWRMVEVGDIHSAYQWLVSLGRGLTVNIAGHRTSEEPTAYDQAFRAVTELLSSELKA